MNVNDLVISEAARMDVYKGLSACYCTPETTLANRLNKMEQQLAFLGSDAFSPTVLMRNELQCNENLDKLTVEFARLFIGPYRLPAPPYGSIYLDGERKIMGDSTIDVRQRYLDSGLVISEIFKDAPDHITAELEFMHFLVSSEINAIRSGQFDESAECLVRQKSFLASHLGAWIADFSRDVERSTTCGFYCHMARVTRVFITEDLQYLSSLNVYQAC